MDTGGATPGGTPTPGSPSATPPPLCIQEQPSSTTHVSIQHILTFFLYFLLSFQLELHGELSKIPTSLTPRSIFKKTASQTQSLPPMPHRDVDLPSCSVPLTSHHVKYVPAPTPSPDSAIHSTIYSPSQSPVQSRHGHFSGFSSPYHSSHRTSPSLSRNNSDASQYGGSQYSCSSATSPISPTHSPVTSSRYSHHPGYPSPAIPSSPLPSRGHLSLPLYSHPVILPRHDEEHSTECEGNAWHHKYNQTKIHEKKEKKC